MKQKVGVKKMDRGFEEMLSELTQKGLSEDEAVQVVEYRLRRCQELLNKGEDEVFKMLSDNIWGEDYSPQFNKLLEAGLSREEAIGIFKNRFCLRLSQIKVEKAAKLSELNSGK